jgi:hypothetical protein
VAHNQNSYLHVQVVFSQGVVKSFLAPKEILMDDFMRVVKLHGRVKRLRHQPDCTQAEALALCAGGATIVEARRVNHVQA